MEDGWGIKRPDAWLSTAFDRIMDTMRQTSLAGRNTALRNAGYRWGRIRHIANGHAETYDQLLAQEAMAMGLPKKEVAYTLARAIRDGREAPTQHYIADDAEHDTGPRLRIRRSAIDPGDPADFPLELKEPRKTTTEDARAIWRNAEDALGTPAEAYLRQRGLAPHHVLTDVRHAKSRDYHYTIFPIRNDDGALVAVQRISVDATGKPINIEDRKRKMGVGPIGEGAFIALEGDGPTIVCDGAEDALSIAAACIASGTQANVKAALTSPTRLLAPDVIYFADNDGGLEAAKDAARKAGALVCAPDAPHKDANDLWRASGAEGVMTAIRAAQPPSEIFKSWEVIDPATIAPRQFIYGRHYIRRFASLTVAPGGLGKSLLVLAEMIAIATGRPILGVTPTERERVVYFNAEDPHDEIVRRVLAICQLHGIDQKELVGWLHIASGRERELILSAGENGDIVEATFEAITAWHQKIGAAVYCFDPLANMTESPETNDVFRRLGKRLSRLSDTLNCGVEIVHHTRKLGGREAEVEDSRGGGALVGAVRSARVLNPMTMDEAVRAGLDTHIDFFRVEAAGKNNLSRPSDKAEWFERVSIELPNGDSVAAPRQWFWPDAFDGVSAEDARRVQIAIAEMEDNPPRENSQARAWAGHVIGRVLGFDTDEPKGRERAKQMLKAWLKSGVLSAEDTWDARAGRDVKVILAGPNNPAAQS